MKQTAVLIYDQFCQFEIAPAMEMLALAGKPVTVFAVSPAPVRSEEGWTVLPDKTIDELDISEYDSLLLPGAADIRSAVEDERVIAFIRRFEGMPIGAISIAPVLLLKAGMLGGKPFMAGIDPEELAEEGFTAEQLSQMHGWTANLYSPIESGYLRTGNIITSVSYNFVRWALAFGEMVGVQMSPKTFGL